MKSGISYRDFLDMSIAEVIWAIRSNHLQNEVKWQHTREIVSIIYNVNAKKGKQKKSRDLFPLTIDKQKKETKRITLEEFRQLAISKGFKLPQATQ